MKKILGVTLLSTCLLGGTVSFAADGETNSKGEINFKAGQLIPWEPGEPGGPEIPGYPNVKQAFPNFWFGTFETKNEEQTNGLVDGEKWGEKALAHAFIQDNRGSEGSWKLDLAMSDFTENTDVKHDKANEKTSPEKPGANLDGEEITLKVPQVAITDMTNSDNKVTNDLGDTTITEGSTAIEIANVEVTGSAEYDLDMTGVQLVVPGSRAVKMKDGAEQYTVLTWNLTGGINGTEAGYGLR